MLLILNHTDCDDSITDLVAPSLPLLSTCEPPAFVHLDNGLVGFNKNASLIHLCGVAAPITTRAASSLTFDDVQFARVARTKMLASGELPAPAPLWLGNGKSLP